MENLSKNANRFMGFAELYDNARPRMPLYPVEIITGYLGKRPKLVADLGCGTGLSSEIWKAYADAVVGVEPSDDMRAVASAKEGENLTFIKGYAHETGLAEGCADAVVCSQSFHWMEPVVTLTEVNRILRQGGVFATVDCDWPPVGDWQAEEAYLALIDHVSAVEHANPEFQQSYFRWDKKKHLENIRRSGWFRYCREIVFSNREPCTAERFVGLALSQGGLQGILKRKPELVADQVETFRRRIVALYGNREFTVDFCYRMRVGVK